MISVLGGLGAAVLWAAATLASSRSSRLIASSSVVAWVMVVGLVVALPGALLDGIPAIDLPTLGWLVVVGVGNVGGLILVYAALRVGKVGIVAPVTSTEGAITAVIAIVLGERIVPGAAITLAVIAIGVTMAAIHRDQIAPGAPGSGDSRRSVLLAMSAAGVFAFGLYAAGHVSAHLPPIWVVLPARLLGTVALALPLALTGRLELTRAAAPLVVIAGLGELFGSMSYAFGARSGIAIAAVLSTQFAAIAAIAAFVLFRERLQRTQILGAAMIAIGVGALTYLQS